jgi:hypothetical protein
MYPARAASFRRWRSAAAFSIMSAILTPSESSDTDQSVVPVCSSLSKAKHSRATGRWRA